MSLSRFRRSLPLDVPNTLDQLRYSTWRELQLICLLLQGRELLGVETALHSSLFPFPPPTPGPSRDTVSECQDEHAREGRGDQWFGHDSSLVSSSVSAIPGRQVIGEATDGTPFPGGRGGDSTVIHSTGKGNMDFPED